MYGIKNRFFIFVFCVSFILIGSEISNAQSLSDIYDMGVNFGQMEAYSIKGKEKEYVAQTALPRARQHAINAKVFQLVDVKFDSLSKEYIDKGSISHASIEATRIYFENQIKLNNKYFNVFDMGVNLGQIETFAQLKQKDDIDFVDKFALPRAKAHANLAGIFQRIENIFQTLSPSNRTEENFERKTLAARLTFREQINLDKSVFRAGAYKSKLLVDGNDILIGYPNARTPSVLRDWLHVRSLVLDDGSNKVVFASIDALLIYDKNLLRIKREIKKLTGIENILLVATHDHSGPEFSANDTNLTVNQRVREEQIITTIVIAAGSLEPAEIGVGWGESNQGFNRVVRSLDKNTNAMTSVTPTHEHCVENETYLGKEAYLFNNFLDPLDNEIGVVRIRNIQNKKTIATLVNYAMHAVVFGEASRVITADYVGHLSKIVENDVGGVSLFLQGAAGDTNPWCGVRNEVDGNWEVLRIGYALGKNVLGISQRIRDFETNQRLLFTSKKIKIWDANNSDVPPPIGPDAELNTISIGRNLAFATFPGEFFADLGLRLKRESLFKNAMFVGYTNHAIGYVPPNSDCKTGGYGTMPYQIINGKIVGAMYVKCGTGAELITSSIQMLREQFQNQAK